MSHGFEWDENKNRENLEKHGIAFEDAQYAFADPQRVIAKDLTHSQEEERWYCFGKVGAGILTVRFTYRRQHYPHYRRWVLAERKTDL